MRSLGVSSISFLACSTESSVEVLNLVPITYRQETDYRYGRIDNQHLVEVMQVPSMPTNECIFNRKRKKEEDYSPIF
jgi:hypothetical protein